MSLQKAKERIKGIRLNDKPELAASTVTDVCTRVGKHGRGNAHLYVGPAAAGRGLSAGAVQESPLLVDVSM